jgi:inosine-uridine nucleoside N-ribohydrolase
MARKIILDCDPGIDDAMAIAFAVGSADIDLAGITTVAGNVGLDKTTANALRLLEFFGAARVPVTAGAAGPLARPAITAEHAHGADRLRGLPLPAATAEPRPGAAADYIVDTVLAAPGEITLVAVGPLTNVALALRREPALTGAVRDFVIMGGSTTRGNVTPAAEFNIAADPEAAAEVFTAGWTVTMVGLDVTLRATATAAVLERLGGLGRLADKLLLPGLRQFDADLEHVGSGEPAVHDVCAVAHVARPGLLGCVPARVDVETQGRFTAGMTVTDFRAAATDRNALVAMSIDVAAFWDTVGAAYGRLATRL